MKNFVGCRTVEITDNNGNKTNAVFPMIIFYPTDTREKPEKLGPYDLSFAADASIKNGIFPLVLISHGSGGSHLVYRTLAHHLASHGFIVGIPEHPFNNRNNNTLENTVDNLINRPRHLKACIDWFYTHEQFGVHLKPDFVSVIGHSMRGYTALALAGGKPTSFSRESPNNHELKVDVTSDPRVKALVLLAPATVWFRYARSLNKVNASILMLTAEKDELTDDFHSQVVLNGVPKNIQTQHRIIENAGHFSFIDPFPQEMTRVTFPPSQDPPGFNRRDFLQRLNAEVLEFLQKKNE